MLFHHLSVFSAFRAACLPHNHHSWDCGIDLLLGLCLLGHPFILRLCGKDWSVDWSLIHLTRFRQFFCREEWWRARLPGYELGHSKVFSPISASTCQGQTMGIFTNLDLRSAYNLIYIRAGDGWKTAFSTMSGHYQYNIMTYGLASLLTNIHKWKT